MDFELIAEGLLFPEGPIAMADGSIVLVEAARGTLSRVWRGRTEVIADLGDAPNGAAIGPDGAVYVCNNGGFEWREVNGLLVPVRASADYKTGRIERVDLATGRFERIYETFEGERLGGPNDIVFDRTGGFWFTDIGKTFARQRDHSCLFYARPDGSHLHRAVHPAVSFNGVGLSPDESVVYCNDTETQAVHLRPARPRRVHAAGSPAARQPRGGSKRQRLLGDAAQRRHHDFCAGRLVRAPGASGSVDDEHLLRRRRHARCVHHAVRDRQAGEGALATSGPEAELHVVRTSVRRHFALCRCSSSRTTAVSERFLLFKSSAR
jgi:SMP-30/gluconolaconase/LRE-like protein